jgi:SSS family solute:Na+ symporter
MGVIAGMSAALHGFSTGVIQDVILPNVKRRLEPKAHIRLLRISAVAIAVFGIVFSLYFKVPDYLVMVTQLMSAIYLAGIGAVVWGGLYWRRATTQGAWAAMIAGSVLALLGMLLQEYWKNLFVPALGAILGPSAWLAANPDKFPLNGQSLSAIIMGVCLALFLGVSLLTCRERYDLDKLLHRGKYRVAEEHKVEVIKGGLHLMRLAGVDENFSRGDRVIAYFTFFWGLAPNLVGAVVVAWNLFYERWSNEGWWSYHYFWSVSVPVAGGVITTIWFTWGTSRDMFRLFKDLREAKQDASDDGQVHEDAPKA